MAKQKDWSRPIGDIVADIRKEWEIFAWGRQVTGRKTNITFDATEGQSPAEKLGWVRHDGRSQQSNATERDREPDREPNGPDRGIDL